jgi:predicted RND superfamily exporter protein
MSLLDHEIFEAPTKKMDELLNGMPSQGHSYHQTGNMLKGDIMNLFQKYRFSKLSAIMAVFCIMMAISAVSAAEETNDSKLMKGIDEENNLASMMNRTIEMIDKTTESLESIKADANDTTIENIEEYLTEIESIRSNIENADSVEELNIGKTSLDELLKKMTEELELEIPMDSGKPEVDGMGNQAAPGSSQLDMGNQTERDPSHMPEIGNQSKGQAPMESNDSGMMESSQERTKEMQNSSDDSGIFEKIKNFFGSLFN